MEKLQKKKTVGIVGLGLIGGSFLKAYRESGDWNVYGYDKSRTVTQLALLCDEMDAELTYELLEQCDLLLVALYPTAAVAYLEAAAPYIAKNTIVIDCCGTKRMICEKGFALAKEYGFTYIGGHPMAGRHYSGFKYSESSLYDGTSMILVPEKNDDIRLLDRVKTLLAPAHFAHLTVTTAEQHDEMIAFTSQMAHLVSNAYIKSPTAKRHHGFSAGSYRDLTRVAWLAEDMWTELFLENKDNLLKELKLLMEALREYEEALEGNDTVRLRQLLLDGKRCKEEVDGR